MSPALSIINKNKNKGSYSCSSFNKSNKERFTTAMLTEEETVEEMGGSVSTSTAEVNIRGASRACVDKSTTKFTYEEITKFREFLGSIPHQ
jgi:hypothetical protein